MKGRISQIKREIEETDSDWDREKLQERLAKLAGGVAVVKVGAATEVELKEKKHRIEDALSATRAAIEEGIVAGGGTALVRSRAAVNKVIAEPDRRRGHRRSDRRACARRAAQVDRHQRRLRGRRHGARGRAREGLDRPQRPHRASSRTSSRPGFEPCVGQSNSVVVAPQPHEGLAVIQECLLRFRLLLQ